MDIIDTEDSLHITSKIIMSSDNVSLRRYKTYVNDNEYVKCRSVINGFTDPFILDTGLQQHIIEVVQNLKSFKICQVCRILYKDSDKIQYHTEMKCNNCMFDDIFSFRDETCIICQDNYHDDNNIKESTSFSLSCGHIFHSKCIMKLFLSSKKRECPICKEIDNSNY